MSVKTVQGVRILCIAEIRGKLSQINELAREHDAQVVLHTGNFGFFDGQSIKRIPVKTLRHIVAFSPLIDTEKVNSDVNGDIKQLNPDALSELPQFLSGKLKLNVPVYTIYGASEDLGVIEKFKSGEYKVPNLHIIDESTTFQLPTKSDLKIRLFGLGGNLLLHRFFDNGDGTGSIAGTYGLMWTTALQVGQLCQTVHSTFDENEVRIFLSHPCPSREGLLAQLALTLRADFTISSGLHFIYTSSFNEYTTAPTFDLFRGKLASARASFMDVWTTVESQITPLVSKDPKQKQLLDMCLEVFEAMPSHSTDSSKATNEYLLAAYKSMWNFNLCDVQSGTTVINVVDGKFSWESRSTGFDFKFRTEKSDKKTENHNGSSSVVVTDSIAPSSSSNNNSNSNNGTAAALSTSSNFGGSSTTAPYDTTTPGIWIPSCPATEEEIIALFDEKDRGLITKTIVRDKQGQLSSKKYCLVYFKTDEDAKGALERLGERASGAALITPQKHTRGGRGGGHHSWGRGRGGASGRYRRAGASMRGKE